MTPTEADYWRDAYAMAYIDMLPADVVFEAVKMAETGEAFNAAIWATSRLREITDEAADAAYISRRK